MSESAEKSRTGGVKNTSSSGKTTVWRLKKGSDRRFKSGHPWVYSNELQGSPKGIEPGEKITLCAPSGEFLAHGYGNPGSLIAFRVISKVEADSNWNEAAFLSELLSAAWSHREKMGLTSFSFRWVFGEGDNLPGLILDLYRLKSGPVVLVFQAHTAGMNKVLPTLIEAAMGVATKKLGSEVGVIVKNDVTHRKLEGVSVDQPDAVVEIEGVDFKNVEILTRGPAKNPSVFTVDLLGGQKTGFFLDQSENVSLLAAQLAPSQLPKTIRMLDLCSYVGQWGTKTAQVLKERGITSEITFFDASENALKLAKKNAESVGAKVKTIKGDILEDMKNIPDRSFDLVISDPPALISGRKDIPQGTHAYLKVNTEALRVLAPGGRIVASSCSQLLEESEFERMLAKAATRSARTVRWTGRGSQAIDHPVRMEFPEGMYLKAWFGRVED